MGAGRFGLLYWLYSGADQCEGPLCKLPALASKRANTVPRVAFIHDDADRA